MPLASAGGRHVGGGNNLGCRILGVLSRVRAVCARLRRAGFSPLHSVLFLRGRSFSSDISAPHSVIPPALSEAEGTGMADFLFRSRRANVGHGVEGLWQAPSPPSPTNTST
jgi:hypothetical protein